MPASDKLGETGRPVWQGLKFHPDKNNNFLTIEKIIAFHYSAGV